MAQTQTETRPMMRLRKRAEAEGRQAAHDKLSTAQKLEVLDLGKLRALKQRARLERQLEREEAAAAKAAAKVEKADA